MFGELLAAEAMRELDFPVYYRVTNPRTGRTEIIGVPAKAVSVRGVTAVMGDYIMGDADGLAVMSADHVDEIVSVAEEIQKIEAKVMKNIRKGESLMKIINFEKFRREHERAIRSNLEYHLKGK